MKSINFALFAMGHLFFSSICQGQETQLEVELDKEQIIAKKIDTYVKKLMKADGIPGMAVAVIHNKRTIFEKYYGLANIEHRVPVSQKTLFRVYSTSKLITSIAVFQLIERGKLKLSDSIDHYIEDLPQSWRKIKIEHLLTHSSGLPEYKSHKMTLSDSELIQEMVKEDLHFEAGSRFEYNQTNFWFLKRIVEKISEQNFAKFIKANQFHGNRSKLIYASNSLVAIPNRVAKYQFNQTRQAYEMTTFEAGPRSHAGNGLNINLKSLIAWNKDLDSNRFIGKATKKKMLSAYPYKNDRTLFGYSWGIFGPKEKRYYGFAGGGVSALMKFPDHDLTIIILSNGFKNRPVISNAVTYISGLCDPKLIRKDRMRREDQRLNSFRGGSRNSYKAEEPMKNR